MSELLTILNQMLVFIFEFLNAFLKGYYVFIFAIVAISILIALFRYIAKIASTHNGGRA